MSKVVTFSEWLANLKREQLMRAMIKLRQDNDEGLTNGEEQETK